MEYYRIICYLIESLSSGGRTFICGEHWQRGANAWDQMSSLHQHSHLPLKQFKQVEAAAWEAGRVGGKSLTTTYWAVVVDWKLQSTTTEYNYKGHLCSKNKENILLHTNSKIMVSGEKRKFQYI